MAIIDAQLTNDSERNAQRYKDLDLFFAFPFLSSQFSYFGILHSNPLHLQHGGVMKFLKTSDYLSMDCLKEMFY